MLRLLLLAFLAVGRASADEPALDDPRLVSSLVQYLNGQSQNGYTYNDGTIISAHKKENVYIVDAELKISCDPGPCSVEKVKCHGSIRYAADNLDVLGEGTGCELPLDESKVDPTSTDEISTLHTLSEIEISLSEPVKLAHEIQMNDQYAGSGEQFVAVRRDSAGGEGWCAGCPIDISLTADGVPELGNNIIQHLDAHLPNEKHSLRKILRVQRQAQIVNGVRYTLLAEVDTIPCAKVNEEQIEENCQNNIPVTTTCQVSILEKPWIKQSDGSKYRAILSNNCTQENVFGDEGEAISSLNPNPNSDVKVVINRDLQAVQSVNKDEEEITPERLKAVEEQIINNPEQNNPEVSEYSEPQLVQVVEPNESQQQMPVNYHSLFANPSTDDLHEPSTNSEDNLIINSNKNSIAELSNDKKQALNGLMDLFGFENPPIPIEQQENVLSNKFEGEMVKRNTKSDHLVMQTEKKKIDSESSSQSSEEKESTNVRRKRSLLSPKRVKNDVNEKLMNDLAKYGLETLDEFDSDDIKRVVLQVLDFKTSQKNNSIFYFLKISAGMSKCLESNTHDDCTNMLLNGKHKLCNIEILVTPEGNKKVNKASCSNGIGPIKRSPVGEQPVGRPLLITLPDDKITELAELSVNHYDLGSASDKRHKVVNIISAKRQVVAGSLTTIELEIKEVDCEKNQVKGSECGFLDGAIKKQCTSSIWSRPWLNKDEITIDCNPVVSRSKRQIPGGVSPVSLPNDEITQLADLAASHYDLTSTSDYRHRVVNIISATTQVVAGSLKKIEMEIKEIDCKKNQIKGGECGFLEGAVKKQCSASIWSRPWLNKNEITIDCNPVISRNKRQITGGVSPVSLPNDEITQLAELAVSHYDLTSTSDYHHRVVNIKSATTQVVAGSLKKIEMEIKEIDCKKNQIKGRKCGFLKGAVKKQCTASIWSRPWLNKNEITIDCNPVVSRSKRQIPGGVSPVSLPNDEITQLANLAASHYDLTSTSDYRHRVVNIISATTQVVAGSLKKIEMEIKEIDCKKNQIKGGECGFLEGAVKKQCSASIWSRPWLNKNEITIDCNPVISRNKRQITGGASPVSLPNDEITQLAELAVNHYDLTSTSDYRHRVVNIISATTQVVAGSLKKIEMEIKEIDCKKNQIKGGECGFLEGAVKKQCSASIWSRPWLNKNQFTMECNPLQNPPIRIDVLLQPIHHQKDLMQLHNKFEKFIDKYSKPYLKDENEYNKRFEIFSKNLNLINALNKEELGTATYAVNEFADLSHEEFQKKHLGLRTDLHNENAIPITQAEIPILDDVPSSFDWRDKGAVTPVKNQGSCGSCWAFSVTGNIEGQNMIKNGKLLSLSEQELVDCDKLDEGCNGGLPDNAYRAIEKLGGLELESDYPYDAVDEQCHFNKSLTKVQISGAVNISSNEDEMVKWLVANGPMSIGINANAMQFYVGGVSHPAKFLCSPKNLDHGVLIVGYGMKEYPIFKKKMPYWIVKNSWGKSWGEQGYYRVYRGEGTCGLNLMVSSAVI